MSGPFNWMTDPVLFTANKEALRSNAYFHFKYANPRDPTSDDILGAISPIDPDMSNNFKYLAEEAEKKLEDSGFCCVTHYQSVSYWGMPNKYGQQLLNYMVASDYLNLISEGMARLPDSPSNSTQDTRDKSIS